MGTGTRKIFTVALLIAVFSLMIPFSGLADVYAAPPGDKPTTLENKCDKQGEPKKRLSPDCVLKGLIEQEVLDRIAADEGLLALIEQEVLDRIADVNQEEADRKAADKKIKDSGNEAIDIALAALGGLSVVLLAGSGACFASITGAVCGPIFLAIDVSLGIAVLVLQAFSF